MTRVRGDRAYERFDIPQSAHEDILMEASANSPERPWTPDVVNSHGAKIDEDVYAEGILGLDPREDQDRHELLIDGRLDRYRQNVEGGKGKWDLALVEQDFYEHPDEFDVNDEVSHNRDPDDELRRGDADIMFLDFDGYDIHVVEAKPHSGYTESGRGRKSKESEVIEWGDDISGPSERPEVVYYEGSEVERKVQNLGEAWQTVVSELENDWRMYHPEFVFGSDVLNASELPDNIEYALPDHYDQETGYVVGSDAGFRKAESSSDLELLNETFFRGELTELLEGERPEIERKSVI